MRTCWWQSPRAHQPPHKRSVVHDAKQLDGAKRLQISKLSQSVRTPALSSPLGTGTPAPSQKPCASPQQLRRPHKWREGASICNLLNSGTHLASPLPRLIAREFLSTLLGGSCGRESTPARRTYARTHARTPAYTNARTRTRTPLVLDKAVSLLNAGLFNRIHRFVIIRQVYGLAGPAQDPTRVARIGAIDGVALDLHTRTPAQTSNNTTFQRQCLCTNVAPCRPRHHHCANCARAHPNMQGCRGDVQSRSRPWSHFR